MKITYRILTLMACLYIAQVNNLYASDRESALKAGLIFNFAVYSKGKWFDAVKHKNYLICSPDLDFVKVASQVLQHKKVQYSDVVVQHIPVDARQIHNCHSIFFSINSKLLLESNSLATDFSGAMLIGESDGFIERGGHINFFLAGGKIRFEINPIGLSQSNIEISSKVIRLGKVVVRGEDE